MARDDREPWLEDFSLDFTRAEIARRVREDVEASAYAGSKLLAALWMTLASVLGGVLGALTVSYALWSSPILGFAAIAGLPVLWWLLSKITLRMFGRGVRFLTIWSMMWGWQTGLYTMWGSQLESTGWAYGVSIGMTLLGSIFYTSFGDQLDLRRRGAWDLAFPFGLLAAGSATFMYRNLLADPDTVASAAQAGGLAAFLFTAPMMVLLIFLWDSRKSMRRLAVLYLHNDSTAPEAVQILSAQLERTPEDTDLLNLRAVGWSRVGEAGRAEADWQEVLRLKPRSVITLLGRGLAALRSGRLDEAVSLLEAAVKRRPKHALSHFTLGQALERRGDAERAIAHHELAFDRSPNARTLTHLASARVAAGQYEEAIQDCKTAIAEFDSIFARTWLVHARALAGLGLKTQAAKTLRDAIDLGGDIEEGVEAEARRELKALKSELGRAGHEPERTA